MTGGEGVAPSHEDGTHGWNTGAAVQDSLREKPTRLWATPNTMDHLPQRSPEALLRQATTTQKGRSRPANLREQVDPETMKLWPTPNARQGGGGEYKDPQKILERMKKGHQKNLGDMVKLWPTPQAADNRDRGNMSTPAIKRRIEKGKQVMLSMSVSEKSGALNPEWVEWLMGFPAGWTNLKESQE